MTTRSSTPSEGEIVESDSEKATTSLPSVNGISVDRHSRKRASVSRSPSPIRSPRRYKCRSRSRSPYREPRGAKRPREDDSYNDQNRSDPRRFKVHYEERIQDRSRARNPHSDLDRGGDPYLRLRYDDRGSVGRSRDKRQRTRSRSPPHFGSKKTESERYPQDRRDVRSRHYTERDRGNHESQENRGRLSREQSVSDRGLTPVAAAPSKREAENRINQTQHNRILSLNSSHVADKYVSVLGLNAVC